MLPKKNRLDRGEIIEIFKSGRSKNTENLSFKFVIIKDQSQAKVAFSVPKKVVKSAVKRNLLRRRGYNTLSPIVSLLPKNLMGVFVFKNQSFQIFGGKKISINTKIKLENEIRDILKEI